MPPIRKQQPHGGWSELHLQQLRDGADANYQPFGEVRVRTRRREGPQDFRADTMPLAERAWHDLRDELLAEADCPEDVWAYRRFDEGHDDAA